MDYDLKSHAYDMEPNFSYDTVNPMEFLQIPADASPVFANGMNLTASPTSNALELSSGQFTHALSDNYSYTANPLPTSTFPQPIPRRPFTPIDGMSISATGAYNLSAGDMSSDGMTSGRRSPGSGTNSPPATVAPEARVPRSYRFNPLVPTTQRPQARAQRRRSTRSTIDSDDDDDDFQPSAGTSVNTDSSRREVIRKQRIESEQRRRDELREGYERLKTVLPATNQKTSKVVVLDKACQHLRHLQALNTQLEDRVREADGEVRRLRNINEALMLSNTDHRRAVAAAAAGGIQIPSF